MIEIERKFLVNSDAYRELARSQTLIVQAYLSRRPECTIRVRVQGPAAFLTIKGKSNNEGTMRLEWEFPIPVPEAHSLLTLAEPTVIEKVRYEVLVGSHCFEVDEFFGDNEGLVVAELELQHASETFPHPEWLGAEVTGDGRYYNSRLSQHPYREWSDAR